MKRMVALVLVGFFFTATTVFGAEAKIGFVDLQKALNFSLAGKAAKGNISKKVKEYEGTIEGKKRNNFV